MQLFSNGWSICFNLNNDEWLFILPSAISLIWDCVCLQGSTHSTNEDALYSIEVSWGWFWKEITFKFAGILCRMQPGSISNFHTNDPENQLIPYQNSAGKLNLRLLSLRKHSLFTSTCLRKYHSDFMKVSTISRKKISCWLRKCFKYFPVKYQSTSIVFEVGLRTFWHFVQKDVYKRTGRMFTFTLLWAVSEFNSKWGILVT